METSLHFTELSIGKIIAATVAQMFVCTLWYSPLLFQKAWTRLSGIRPGDVRASEMRRNYLIYGITSLISAALLNLIALHSADARAMIFSGVGFIWLFVMLEQLNHVLWERQPIALFILQTFRSLACLMAGGAVFYFWR